MNIELDTKKKNEIENALFKSKSKKDFKTKYPELYLITKKTLQFKNHPFFLKLSSLMDNEILEHIKKHNSLHDLRINDPKLYDFIRRNNKKLLYDVFPKKELPNNVEDIISLLKEYRSISEFSKKESTLYKKLLKKHKNLINVAFPSESKWSLEKSIKEASKYETRSEFKRKSGGCYTWIRENGFLNTVCINMKDGYVKRHNKQQYSYDEIKEICSRYKSRTSLKKENHWVFYLAEKNNWLDLLLPDLNKNRTKKDNIIKEKRINMTITKREILKNIASKLGAEFSSKELKDLAIKNGVNLGINNRTLYDFLSKSNYVSRNKKNNKFSLNQKTEEVTPITIDELKKITTMAKENALKNYCQKILIRAKDYALSGKNEFEYVVEIDPRFSLSDVVFEMRNYGFKVIPIEDNSSKIIISW